MELRLQKYIADCGVCSRRAAEELITAGKVTVNGVKAQLGQKVGPSDVVMLDGKVLRHVAHEFTYIMLNKPRGYITTLTDEEGRHCVADLLEGIEARVVPIGRLDRNSEGLLLLSDDGDLVYKLTHPSHDVPKRYLATLRGHIGGDVLDKLRGEIVLDGHKLRPVEIEVLSKDLERSVLQFTLYEGRNRQIRRMCEEAGTEVIRLKRVAVGDLRLAEVKPGKWRHLTAEEVAYLKEMTT